MQAPPARCLAQLWLAAVGVEYCSAEQRALGREQGRSKGAQCSGGSRRGSWPRWGRIRSLWKQGLRGPTERGRAAPWRWPGAGIGSMPFSVKAILIAHQEMGWQVAHPCGETEVQVSKLSRSQPVRAGTPEPRTGRRQQGVRQVLRAQDPHLPHPRESLDRKGGYLRRSRLA